MTAVIPRADGVVSFQGCRERQRSCVVALAGAFFTPTDLHFVHYTQEALHGPT
jgi:hypothetical protein